MRNFFIIFFIFSANILFSQQCKLSLDQLFKIMDYSQSDFDTFALSNDFSYDSKNQVYQCENSDNPNVLHRINQSGIVLLTYTFLDKQLYLDFKEILKTGELTETHNEKGKMKFQYLLNGEIVLLETKTMSNNYNAYSISISQID